MAKKFRNMMTGDEVMALVDIEYSKLSADAQLRVDQGVASHVFKREISRAIREARTGASMSQQELSDKTGIAQAQLSRFESAKSNPTVDTLLRIGAVLGLELTFRPVQK